MTTKMVELPWHDGTTRAVPEWTPYATKEGFVWYARNGGYCLGTDRGMWYGKVRPHSSGSDAVRIFTEAPEPLVKVEVPTGIAAVVSTPEHPDDPGYVLTKDGWRGVWTYLKYDPSEIARKLRTGAKVLFEGIDVEDEESEKTDD